MRSNSAHEKVFETAGARGMQNKIRRGPLLTQDEASNASQQKHSQAWPCSKSVAQDFQLQRGDLFFRIHNRVT